MKRDRQGLIGNDQASTFWKGDETLKFPMLSSRVIQAHRKEHPPYSCLLFISAEPI
jgi:hypothetical protein